MNKKKQNEIAVFGGGCFWCTEAIFSELHGVKSVMPGYAGGTLENPTYQDVATGKTGYAESIKIEYDPKTILYNDLLTVFFGTHDSTTLNRQGADVGTEYRSVIFCATPEQKKIAEKFITKLKTEDSITIVTSIEPLDNFFPAEDYHHNYYNKNQNAPYCQLVIDPKLEKLKNNFKSFLKNQGV